MRVRALEYTGNGGGSASSLVDGGVRGDVLSSRRSYNATTVSFPKIGVPSLAHA